jgi:hypothetical protein
MVGLFLFRVTLSFLRIEVPSDGVSPSVGLEGRVSASSLTLLTVWARGPVNRMDLVSAGTLIVL